MDYAKIIGLNIRYERKRRGLTIDDFAKVIGMAPGFLGLIERGQRGTSVKNMVAIAEFFDISLDDLITKDLSNGGADMKDMENTRSAKARRALKSLVSSLTEDEIVFITSVIKSMNKMNTGFID
jgi:transcriptional regulator with XRE-family HTH domain